MIPFVALAYVIFCLVAMLNVSTGAVGGPDGLWAVIVGGLIAGAIIFVMWRSGE